MANETTEGLHFETEDIKKADAGNSFKENNNYVKPWENVDGDNYEDVRNGDKILQVLTSQNNMQFTKGTAKDYLRLLMPMYTRRVEVEDLNRNFWVIGQTISALCEYIFNREEEKITEVHREVIDWPRAIDKPYRDIHSFVEVPKFTIGTNGKISEPSRLVAYKEMYPESNLCLLIRCRLGNYEKEYYHTEVYPYIVFYDVNIDQWYAVELKDYGKEKQLGITLRIDSSNYTDSSGNKIYDYMNIRGVVYGITETFPTYYRLYYPLSELTPNYIYYAPGASAPTPVTVKEDYAHAYHGMISIKPSLTNVKYSNGKFSVKIEFTVTDIARKLNFQIPTPNGLKPGSQTEPQQDDPSSDSYVDKGDNAKLYLTTFVMTSDEPDEPDIITSEDTYAFIKGGDPFYRWPKVPTGQTQPSNGFREHQRNSGYQVGLDDMISYLGVTEKQNS